MANEKHIALIKQGPQVWNQWREQNPGVRIDLCEADLSDYFPYTFGRLHLRGADLRRANLTGQIFAEADFSGADFQGALLNLCQFPSTNLSGANFEKAALERVNFDHANLENANLKGADLTHARLTGANFRGVNLTEAFLSGVNLSNTDLRGANLSRANLLFANLNGSKLHNVNLSEANLTNADLEGCASDNANFKYANLYNADLTQANLKDSDFTGANLSAVKALHADLSRAILTGACIADWQIGSSTRLDSVICDYIFRTYVKSNFSGRLPVDPNSTFAPSEFAQRFQIVASALETIDLTFTEGVNWKAFFTSFQELRLQYPDGNLSIQGMERKVEAFIIRLEINQAEDKAAIETKVKQRYLTELKAIEAEYEKQLRLQGEHYAEEARRLIETERQEKATLMGIIESLAKNQGPKYDMRGSHFTGGFAETVHGNQIGIGKLPTDIENLEA